MNSNNDRLQRSYSELLELQLLLEKVGCGKGRIPGLCVDHRCGLTSRWQIIIMNNDGLGLLFH